MRALRLLRMGGAAPNLLTKSEQFDHADWTIDAGTVSANAVAAPDGATTADKYIPSAVSSGTHRVRQLLTAVAAPYNLSFYAKPAGYSWIKLRLNGAYVNFNVTTGVIGAASSGNDIGTMQAVGGGWYRCSAVLVPAAGAAFAYVYASTTDDGSPDTTAFAGDGTSGVYIWGAQLTLGARLANYRRKD